MKVGHSAGAHVVKAVAPISEDNVSVPMEPYDMEGALIEGDIDCYVCMLVDVPQRMDRSLTLAAVLARTGPCDVIVPSFSDLDDGAVVRCDSGIARVAVSEARPGLVFEGPSDDSFDAEVMDISEYEASGDDRSMDVLDTVPQPAQGIVAIVCRADDTEVRQAIRRYDHLPTRLEAGVERGIMDLIGVGCTRPIGIRARFEDFYIHVDAVAHGFTDGPRYVSEDVPSDYVLDELLGIAEYLTGGRMDLV